MHHICADEVLVGYGILWHLHLREGAVLDLRLSVAVSPEIVERLDVVHADTLKASPEATRSATVRRVLRAGLDVLDRQHVMNPGSKEP